MPFLPPSCVVPLLSDSHPLCTQHLPSAASRACSTRSGFSPGDVPVLPSQLSEWQICPGSQVTTLASSRTPVLPSTHMSQTSETPAGCSYKTHPWPARTPASSRLAPPPLERPWRVAMIPTAFAFQSTLARPSLSRSICHIALGWTHLCKNKAKVLPEEMQDSSAALHHHPRLSFPSPRIPSLPVSPASWSCSHAAGQGQPRGLDTFSHLRAEGSSQTGPALLPHLLLLTFSARPSLSTRSELKPSSASLPRLGSHSRSMGTAGPRLLTWVSVLCFPN